MADDPSVIADGIDASDAEGSTPPETSGEDQLTDEQKRANVLRLAFGGDEERFAEFLRVIHEEIPPGTGVVLRGSAITGRRWKDGAAFDAV